MNSWSEGVKGYPCGAKVQSTHDDGVFVTIGLPGVIVGREFPRYPLMDELLVTIRWANQTQTRVACDQITRVGGYEEAGAA